MSYEIIFGPLKGLRLAPDEIAKLLKNGSLGLEDRLLSVETQQVCAVKDTIVAKQTRRVIRYDATPDADGRIKCPYCAERILPDARKCRFCGEDILSKSSIRRSSSDPFRTHAVGPPIERRPINAPESVKSQLQGLFVILTIIGLGLALVDYLLPSMNGIEKIDPKTQIESGFSWDGSHKEFTQVIRSGLNNPDSFIHVRTTYVKTGKYLIITMVYRASNAFNAIITTTAIGKADLDGHVIEVISR